MTRTLAGRRIVVGVDGTAASAAAVCWAVREARLRHGTVHLVFACDHDRRLRAPYAVWSAVPHPEEDSAAARALLSAAAELAGHRLPPGRLKAEVAHGPPARVLLERASGAELLVLGTTRPARQPAGQPPEAMGPVARACLRHAPCPVVVVAPYDQPARRGTTQTRRRHMTPRQYAPRTAGQPLLPGAAASRVPAPTATG